MFRCHVCGSAEARQALDRSGLNVFYQEANKTCEATVLSLELWQLSCHRMTAMHNFHLPLPEELHQQLREEAAHTGQPATVLARQALERWLTERQRRRRHAQIATFARAHAGTPVDLDPALEEAGLEALAKEGSP